jgi:hypothetical protein
LRAGGKGERKEGGKGKGGILKIRTSLYFEWATPKKKIELKMSEIAYCD